MSKVLLAQSQTEIRSLMILLLRGQGYEVEVAADLAQIRQQALHHPPDLIILDIGFPGVDSNKPVEIFRSGAMGVTLAETPILLSATHGEAAAHGGSTLGADGLFAPRTPQCRPFLTEVQRLLPPPISPTSFVYSWRLDKDELPAFLFACFLFELNGIVTFRGQRVHKNLHFVDGWIRSASSSVESDWLGKMLLARRLVSEHALNEVERALPTSNRKIGEEFVARGHLSRDVLEDALRDQYASIVMSVFEWEEAEVSLRDGPPNPAPHLLHHPFRLIVDGLCIGMTENDLDALMPPLDCYLVPTVWTAFQFAEVELSPAEKQLLLAIDGQRKVEALLSSSVASSLETKRFFLALLIAHAIVASEMPQERPVTFSRQVEGSPSPLIEGLPTVENEAAPIEPPVPLPGDPPLYQVPTIKFEKRSPLLDRAAALRYLAVAVAALLVVSVLFAVHVLRDAAQVFERHDRLLQQINAGPTTRDTARAKQLLAQARELFKDDMAGSIRALDEALRLDPQLKDAEDFQRATRLFWSAKLASDPEESSRLLEEAAKLDPFFNTFRPQPATQK